MLPKCQSWLRLLELGSTTEHCAASAYKTSELCRLDLNSVQFVHQELRQIGSKVVTFQGREIRARWDKDLATVIVDDLTGNPIPSTTAFAFGYPVFSSGYKIQTVLGLKVPNPINKIKRHINRTNRLFRVWKRGDGTKIIVDWQKLESAVVLKSHGI